MKYVSQIDANKPREEGRTEKEGRGEKRESVGGREAEIDAELGSMGRGGRRTMHVILEMRGQFQAAKINGTANGAGKSKCKLANGEEWPAVSSIPLRGLGPFGHWRSEFIIQPSPHHLQTLFSSTFVRGPCACALFPHITRVCPNTESTRVWHLCRQMDGRME